MKFCQPHWDRLRKAIDDRGLSDLIAPDGETAAAQMADQLKRAEAGDESETLVNYDPLMAAHWAIVNNVSGLGPGIALELMMPDEDGSDRCPLCYANEGHKLACNEEGCTFTFDDWCERAADDQAEHVRKLREGSDS